MKRILYFLLGLTAFLSLLCSIAASCATNENLMTQGFLAYSRTEHLNVAGSQYEQYAKLICRYLDGEQDFLQSIDPATNEAKDLFSEKENQHLRDVKGIVTGLKIIRWAGGGIALCALAALFFLNRQDRPRLLSDLVRGFAAAALAVLFIATVLAVWAATDFNGLFWTFHRAAFTNDLWLLDPRTHLLAALMPLPFFSWYAGEMCKSLLPVLGMMLLVILARIHIQNTQKKEQKTP